jgi:hypothetical protein
MKWLAYGIAGFLLVVSAFITLVIARLNNHPDWFGTSLDRFQALSLVCDLAPGVASDEATNVRGVETHDFWDGWDRWVTFELPSADAVDALEQAVLNKAQLLASRADFRRAGSGHSGGRVRILLPLKAAAGVVGGVQGLRSQNLVHLVRRQRRLRLDFLAVAAARVPVV